MIRSQSKLSVVTLSLIAVLALTWGAFAQKTTVTILSDTRPAYIEWAEALKERFEAENPDIEIEFIPLQGDPLQRMQVLLAAGMPLDIGWSDPMYVAALARMGVLEDLAPYVAESPQYEDFYPSSLNLFKMGDSLYGLPIELQIAGIFYNMDMMFEAGLPLPDEGWTYDDLRDSALRLLKRDEAGNAVRHGFKIPTGRNWLTVVWAFGGEFVDDWVFPSEFIGNSSEVAAALNYLHDLVRSEAVQDQQRHAAQHVSTVAFPGQQVGMILSNTLAIASLQNITEFDWDVAPLPYGPAGRVGFINSRGWVMFNSAQNKEATWKVLKYFTSPEALELFVEITTMVPPSRDVLINNWLPATAQPANRVVLLHDVETARSPWPLDAAVFNVIQEAVDAVIWGMTPTGTALQQMEELVPPRLAEVYGSQ